MKKTGKMLSLFLSAILLLTMFPLSVSAAKIVKSGSCGDNVTYTLDSDGLLTISGTGDMKDYSAFYVSPFISDTRIKTIVIEPGVTRIGAQAFYDCTELTSVTIPNSVTSISSSAFFGTAWDNAQPDGLVYAGKVAYKYKGTMPANTSIVLAEGTKGIADSAFSGCTGLTSITIPDSVTSIGYSAFSGCTGLTSVTIPDSVTNIGSGAFSGCTGLKDVYCPSLSDWDSFNTGAPNTAVIHYARIGSGSCGENLTWLLDNDGVLTISGTGEMTSVPWGNYKSYIKEIRLPEGLTVIYSTAFSGCEKIKSITIPDSVTSIGDSAFSGCTGLTSVTIPDSVTSIGDSAFSGCTGLTSVTIPDSVTSIGGGAFYNCTGLTDVSIGNGVTSIDTYMFSGCTKLTNIIIGNSVINIGDKAFSGFTELTSITIPDSVTSIGSSAFSGCTGLTSVTIPDSVTSIGEKAFEGCTKLETLVLGKGTESIPTAAFEGCTALTSVTVPKTVYNFYDDAFKGCAAITDVYYLGTQEDWNNIYFGKENQSLRTATIHFHEHDFTEEITLEPTCKDAGEKILTCAGCGETKKEAIPKLTEHTWDTGKVTKEATVDAEGETTYTCTVCGETKTESIAKIIPDNPDNPDTPDTPDKPDQPDQPDKPDTPETKPIDTDTVKEIKKGIFALAGVKAADLLTLAGDGAKLAKADGSEPKAEDPVGSGMTLTKADGTQKTVVVKGDVTGDGKITAADARSALRQAVGLDQANDWQKAAALLSGGEKVSAKDARKILRIAVGLDQPVL